MLGNVEPKNEYYRYHKSKNYYWERFYNFTTVKIWIFGFPKIVVQSHKSLFDWSKHFAGPSQIFGRLRS